MDGTASGCSGHHHGEHGHSHDHSHGAPHGSAGGDDGPSGLAPHREETDVFERMLQAFAAYGMHTGLWLREHEQRYHALSGEHKAILGDWSNKFKRSREALQANQYFVHALLSDYTDQGFNLDPAQFPKPSEHNMSKVRTTLRQFVRDWSVEGAKERSECFEPLIQAVRECFPSPKHEDGTYVNVLVPGSGLCRLVWELAQLGYDTEGNEFSYMMLAASNFVLNGMDEVNEFTIHPYIDLVNNNVHVDDRLRGVQVPDVAPCLMAEGTRMKMSAGEFIGSYGDEENTRDCVVTCFFIDTAHNVINYVKLIRKLLKPGGKWVNLGPLLYHWSDVEGEESVELAWNEVKHVLETCGFEITKHGRQMATYCANQRSMLVHQYNTITFTAVNRK